MNQWSSRGGISSGLEDDAYGCEDGEGVVGPTDVCPCGIGVDELEPTCWYPVSDIKPFNNLGI